MSESAVVRDGTTYIRLPMACACGERRQRYDDMVTECRARLGLRDNTPFVSGVVSHISWRHNASIEDLWQDQWFGLRAKSMGDEPVVVSIECDLVEHGLAALCLWLDEVGKFRPDPDDEDDGPETITTDRSET